MTNRALIVIDPQRIYTDPDASLEVEGAAAILARINEAISYFSKNGEEIIFVRHVHKVDGSDLGRMFDFAGSAEDANFLEGSEEIEYDRRIQFPATYKEFTKNRYSCFSAHGFAEYLKSNRIDTIVISGFMTNYCCESTAREAHDLDYFVDFLMDATGCPHASDDVKQDAIKQVVAATLEGGFARVFTTAEYIANG